MLILEDVMYVQTILLLEMSRYENDSGTCKCSLPTGVHFALFSSVPWINPH